MAGTPVGPTPFDPSLSFSCTVGPAEVPADATAYTGLASPPVSCLPETYLQDGLLILDFYKLTLLGSTGDRRVNCGNERQHDICGFSSLLALHDHEALNQESCCESLVT